MTVRGAKATCDKYASQLVRMRGACQRCGSTKNLEWAHIIRRRHVGNPDGIALRHNLANAWCLCGQCHRLVDSDAVEFTRLVEATIGLGFYGLLIAAKNEPHRRWTEKDWINQRAQLRALLNGAGSVDRSVW